MKKTLLMVLAFLIVVEPIYVVAISPGERDWRMMQRRREAEVAGADSALVVLLIFMAIVVLPAMALAGWAGMSSDQYSDLHQAVLDRDYTQIDRLLRVMNRNINVRDREGRTALHRIAILGDKAMVEFLLKQGASKNIRANDGKFPYDDATDPEIKEMLRPI